MDTQEDRVGRSFEEIRAAVNKKYQGTPLKGDHKRARRSLHYWKNRLDDEGKIFNHVLANQRALEQLLYLDTFPLFQGDWQPIGPSTTYGSEYNHEGIGRVNHVAFATASTWYAGTAGGGLWRTDVAGYYPGVGEFPWYPLTDSLPSLGISGIVVNPDEVDDIYILTGDGESRTYGTRGTQPGVGILHSDDGGNTWNTTALYYSSDTMLEAGYKLIMHPTNPLIMYAACTDGLYRTTDGWVDPDSMSVTTILDAACFDVEFKPDDPQVVYAAHEGMLRRSLDGGESFISITTNMDMTSIGLAANIARMALAVTPSDPEILYVIAVNSNGGLLSLQVSYDAAETFTEMINNSFNIMAGNDPLTETDGQGTYDLAIWASPDNAGSIIVGGIRLWRNNAFGAPGSWIKLADGSPPNYTHVDIHAIETNPFNGDIVVGSDGGLYASSTGGLTWDNVGRGLAITQYYHLDVSQDFTVPVVMGGAQDNGSMMGIGLDDPVFDMIGGGDGFRLYRNNVDGSTIRYRSVQNGILYKHHYIGFMPTEEEITPLQEINFDGTGKGGWDTPYTPNPNSFIRLVAGYGHLYHSYDAGEEWTKLEYPVGMELDESKLISQIAWSKNNSNVLFFYVNDNTDQWLYRCDNFELAAFTGTLENGNCTIVDVDSLTPMVTPAIPTGTRSNTVSDLALPDLNDKQIWLSCPGYTAGRKVYYNADMSADSPWVNISYNLPNVPVHCIEYDVDGIYAGTDLGAFFLPHIDTVWQYFSQGLPTVAVTEIEIDYTQPGKLIFASTFGRGLWWSTPATTERQTHWFVDSSATGANNGSDWANAFSDFQDALDQVYPGDSIWVAKGSYYPQSAGGFSLNEHHVKIRGGFAGTEDSLTQRDIQMNPTILSGDLGVIGDSLDNAYHVLTLTGANDAVVVDGFHITEGYAHTSGNRFGGGIYYVASGASGKPIIKNCRIYKNSAIDGGAGMYLGDYIKGDNGMIISHCTFSDNNCLKQGGGIYLDPTQSTTFENAGSVYLTLDSCTFLRNHGSHSGALYARSFYFGMINLTIDSCIFDRNSTGYSSTGGRGPALHGDIRQKGSMELAVNHSSFTNMGGPGGNFGAGAMYFFINPSYSGTDDDLLQASFTNCNFDSCTTSGSAVRGGAVQFNGETNNYSAAFTNCSFTHCSSNHGGAIAFRSINKKQVTCTFSNCIFTNNTAANRGGALEFNGDGAGYFDVFIDSCSFSDNSGGQSGGIYFLIGDNGSSTSFGKGNLVIMNSVFDGNSGVQGGALGITNQRSTLNALIADCEFTGNMSPNNYGGAVYNRTWPGTVDTTGILYKDCLFSLNASTTNGGAAFNQTTNVIYDNCNFFNNTVFATGSNIPSGGAVANYMDHGTKSYTCEYNQCNFTGNEAESLGGAMYNYFNGGGNMSIVVDSCLFISNHITGVQTSDGRGGAVYTRGGRGIQNFTACDFIDNTGTKEGGAIYAMGNTQDTMFLNMNDCTFQYNYAPTQGRAVYQYASSSRILSTWQNCSFTSTYDKVFFNRQSSSNMSKALFADDCIFNESILSGLEGHEPAISTQDDQTTPVHK